MREADFNPQLEAKKISIATPNIYWRGILAPYNWEEDPNKRSGSSAYVKTISEARLRQINGELEEKTQNGGVVVIDYDNSFVDVLIGRTSNFPGAIVSLNPAQRRNYIQKNPFFVEAYKGTVSAKISSLSGKISSIEVSVDGISRTTSYELDTPKTPTLFTLRKKPPHLDLTARLLLAQHGDQYLVAKPPRKALSQA